MSLLFRKTEQRNLSYQQAWGSDREVSLRGDSLAAALSLVPVYAATGLIADQIAAAPWAVFEKSTGNVPTKAKTQPTLITDPGVNDLDLYSWKHQMVTSMLLRGNAYGFIVESERGVPANVVWLRPDWVEVDEEGPRPLYYYKGIRVDRKDLIHIPLYVVPGSVVGLSPLALFRMQIEMGLEAQRVGRNFFKRGMIPSAILKNTARTLSADQAQVTKERFTASVSSSEPFVTGSDWDYTAIGLPTTDSSFLSGIRATATQIAAIYRVPPEMIGGEVLGQSLTYKNLEQDQIRFNQITLRPIAARVEAVTDRYLPAERYVRFNLDASARADLKTRYEAHEVSIRAGFKTPNEVRLLEELPPLTPDQTAAILLMKPNTGTQGITT